MIYLDNAATTACAQDVVDAMVPYFRETFANASSIDHMPGTAARRAVDEAREAVAELVGARSEDVIFTSGSTEANNLVVSLQRRVITTSVEHPSILDPLNARKRADDVVVAVDLNGQIDVEFMKRELELCRGNTLVTVIATNNETGAEQDIGRLLKLTSGVNALLHIDATQAVGTQKFELRRDGLDALSLSAHKFHGPKGIGALVAAPALRKELKAAIRGGGHERGLRSGTLNVPAIVGFGVASKALQQYWKVRRQQLSFLRNSFLGKLRQVLGDSVHETINGEVGVSPHIISLRIQGVNGRALLGATRDDLAFSLGSACATNKAEPSHVLLALGVDKKLIAQTIRISLSHEQSVDEVEAGAALIATAAQQLRGYSLATQP
jgi:cysteine desulfurase